MIAADDPRHGTMGGYWAGCDDDCCRIANARRAKRQKVSRERGNPERTLAIGTARRIRALMAIGWPCHEIAVRSGVGSAQATHSLLTRKYVFRSVRDRYSEVYDTLSMTPGPSNRVRMYAERLKWPKPMQWDDYGPHDIDDPNATPYKAPRRPDRAIVDEVIVLRAMAGQKVDATTAERVEITRRWLRDGRSLAELCRVQGWRADRYKEAS